MVSFLTIDEDPRFSDSNGYRTRKLLTIESEPPTETPS
jgi:hypothetical protein